jgi:hypothetical protein
LAVGPPGLLDGGEGAGGGGDDDALCDDGPVQVYVLP